MPEKNDSGPGQKKERLPEEAPAGVLRNAKPSALRCLADGVQTVRRKNKLSSLYL
jgi:hypothetical protein